MPNRIAEQTGPGDFTCKISNFFANKHELERRVSMMQKRKSENGAENM